jgi:TolA-binding protein
MRKKTVIILISLLFVISCKSVDNKRVKKDIIGINEQLYELEKDQIVLEEKLKKIIKKNKTFNVGKKREYDEKDIYSKGYKLFIEEKYSNAVSVLKKLVKNFSNDSIIDNTLFWIAEAYMKMDEFDKAIKYYKILYRYFPFSEKADYALYKIGYIYYYKKKDYMMANLAFLKIIREYPTSDFKNSAINFRKKIKKKRRRK